MKINFFLIFCFFLKLSFAQNSDPKFFSPSPDTYALGKYGDIPVQLYTGVPDISVPIYTVTEKDISVPISLSYHGSGIKVDETASSVGLGWVLNAGGVITRSIRGKAEYLSNGMLAPVRADIPACTNCSNASAIDNFVSQHYLTAVVDGQLDGEPDIFYYNFNGRSGKFFFDKNGIPVLNKDDALKISWIEGQAFNSESFEILDELGIKYEFSEREYTWYGTNEGSRVSAWYLSKIISPTGNMIEFTYDIYTYSKTERAYVSQFINIPVNGNSGQIVGLGPNDLTYTGNYETGLMITQINTPKEKIVFSYLGGRLDLPSTIGVRVSLDKISIQNSIDNSPFKSFHLYTSYFEANDSKKYDGPTPNKFQHLNYRLRLDSVKQVSATALSSPPYKFFYLGDNDPLTDDPYTLPYRLSPAQDFWGYYNFSNNDHLLPGITDYGVDQDGWYSEFTPDPNSNNAMRVSLSGGATRMVNASAMKANCLIGIEYPTGGRSNFVFEPNDYRAFQGGLRIKRIQNFSFNESQPMETVFAYSGSSPASHLDPEKYSFQYYYVEWDDTKNSPIPGENILSMFGIPIPAIETRYIKVSAWPTAILGASSDIGYSEVSVQETGKGKVVNSYSGFGDFPDYFNHDILNEETQNENSLLAGLYFSEAFETIGPANFGHKVKSLNYGDFPYNELYSNDWKRGSLTERRTYNENSDLIKSENYTYYKSLRSVVPGYKVLSWHPSNNLSAHLYSKYLLPNTWMKLKSGIVTEYDMNGQNPLTSETKYYYDNLDHLQITRIEKTNSLGVKETQVTSYPIDYPSGTAFIDSMKNRHLWAYPIEKVTYLTKQGQSFVTSGSVTEYLNDKSGLPSKVYSLEYDSPLAATSFKFSNRSAGILPPGGSLSSYSIDSRYKPSYFYHLYDDKGNLVEGQKSFDKKDVYLWGYNKEYPVARIAGSDYATINNIVSQSQIENNTNSDANLRSLLNGLRTLPNTSIWTYTYKPLLGMSSETDPANRTRFFEYDALGRLNVISDNNQEVTKVMDYKFSRDINPNTVYFSNTVQKQTFYKNCNNGVGSAVEYIIPSGTYYSTVSVQDANQKALDEITVRGQEYANDNGYCTYYNDYMSSQIQKNDCSSGTGTYVTYSVMANTFSSVISKADANSKASQHILSAGQNYANLNGQCQGVSAPIINLVNYFPGLTYFPSSIKVEFLKNNTVYQTKYFPNGAEGSYSFPLDADTYKVRFTMSGWPNGQPFTTYYFFSDLWQEWTNYGTDLIVTTDDIVFETGLEYTIRASNSTY